MSSYRIFETETFKRDLSRLSASGVRSLTAKLREYAYPILKSEPHYGPNIKRLKDWEPPTWRYRVGNWRFFYEIDEAEKIIFMTVAEHRREAYR